MFGIVLISSFAGKDLIKGAISGVGGLILATVGTDPFSGTARFTLDSPSLLAGIGLIPGMIGLLAVSEIFEQIAVSRTRERIKSAFSTALPKLKEFWKARVAMSIGAVIGALEGMLPGAGGAIAAFISYDQAKRWSKTPEEFGHGSVEGIAAPECANNVVTGTALVPLLTFGIPGSNSSAILLAAMMMHGIQPGPQIFEGTPDLVYGLFTAMFIANIMMFCVGLLALRPAITLVNIEPPLLLSGILGVIVVGAFALNNQMFEVWIVLGMGLLGFFMNRYGFNVLAMVLGLVLGFMVEANMRRSLLISLRRSLGVRDPPDVGDAPRPGGHHLDCASRPAPARGPAVTQETRHPGPPMTPVQQLTGDFTPSAVPRVVFGRGAVERLPEEVERLGARRALVVSSRTLAEKSDAVARVTALLGDRCVGSYSGAEHAGAPSAGGGGRAARLGAGGGRPGRAWGEHDFRCGPRHRGDGGGRGDERGGAPGTGAEVRRGATAGSESGPSRQTGAHSNHAFGRRVQRGEGSSIGPGSPGETEDRPPSAPHRPGDLGS